MVERKIELRRRRSRHKKMQKLKGKLGNAKSNHDRDLLIQKILRISPWWEVPEVAAK